MHVIKLNQLSFKGPSKWGELTAEGLLNLAVCTCSASAYTKLYLVMTLFGVPAKLFTKLKKCQAIQLEPLIDWFFGKNTLSNWLLKTVKVGKSTLYGPQNALADLSAEEFMYAEAAYERWSATQNPEFLDTLFAILYTRKPFFAVKRCHFNPDKLDAAEKRAKRVRLYVKRAIAINYAGCRNLIIDKHPHIWKKQNIDESKPVKQITYTNWVEMILGLSGDKFGTYEQAVKVNIWLLLADLDKKAKHAAELEARLKK